VSLGYKRQPAEEAVQKASRDRPGIGLEELIKRALGELSSR
jgi:Holliday junction resolvasome RuvABC DNA-binding subunit